MKHFFIFLRFTIVEYPNNNPIVEHKWKNILSKENLNSNKKSDTKKPINNDNSKDLKSKICKIQHVKNINKTRVTTFQIKKRKTRVPLTLINNLK